MIDVLMPGTQESVLRMVPCSLPDVPEQPPRLRLIPTQQECAVRVNSGSPGSHALLKPPTAMLFLSACYAGTDTEGLHFPGDGRESRKGPGAGGLRPTWSWGPAGKPNARTQRWK